MRYVVARYMTDSPNARPLSKVTKTWMTNFGAQADNPFSLRKKLREMRRTFITQRFLFSIRRLEDKPIPQPDNPQSLVERLAPTGMRFLPPPKQF